MVKGRQGERIRLYVRGTILGYKRSKSNQYPNTSLIQIEGVNTKEEVDWYRGKRIDVPNGRVGVIIGKGGETIKYLQLQSGAKLQVPRDMDADPL